MSHIVTIETEVRDAAAVRAACSRLKLQQPEEGTFDLYGGQATGLAVRDRMVDGWMRTGDLGVIDAEGYCQITGRVKSIARGAVMALVKLDEGDVDEMGSVITNESVEHLVAAVLLRHHVAPVLVLQQFLPGLLEQLADHRRSDPDLMLFC